MSQHRLGAVLAGLLLAQLATAGCGVTTGNTDQDGRRTTAERVLGDGFDMDLAHPPSRHTLAMSKGERTTVLKLPERRPFDVRIAFRDGHELDTRGVALVVTSPTSDGSPTSLTVRRDQLSQNDLGGVLDSAVRDLGAEPARAEAVRTQSAQATSGPADVIRTLRTGVASPDRLEIESVVSANEGRVSVSYLVGWKR